MGKQIFAIFFLILTITSSISSDGKCEMLSTDNERSIVYSCVEVTLDDITNLYKQAEWIQFSVSKLSTIPKEAFASFALRRLSFFNCDITYIDPDAFQGLDHLEWFILYGSDIKILRASWFKGMRHLTHLSLEKNNIVYIEPQLFLHIPNLQMLNIEDNDLDCLPEHALDHLRKLKNVRIGKNPWLCSCYTELYRWMVNRNINFEKNKPSEFECMVEYSTQNNQFESRSYRRKWVMSNNKELLEMNKNDMTSLSDPSTTCTSILSHIPNDVESIEISGVTIPTLTNFTFFQFGNSLRSLNMTDCYITDIAPEAFAGLRKLEQLILYNNNISIVKDEWFRDLRALKYLKLDRNGIQRVEPNVFVVLDKLETLSLNHNEIKCLSIDSFSFLRNLKRVNITDNPWDCECKKNFTMWLVRKQIGHEDSARGCDEGQVKASEHEYGSDSGKNSIGQIFKSKLTEINHGNVEGGTDNETESKSERHEIISSSKNHINITQYQQRHSQRLIQEKTITQREQNIMQQQQQQNHRQSLEYRIPASVDFTTTQDNFHNVGQFQQAFRMSGDCKMSTSSNTISWTCSGGSLLDLDKIPTEAQFVRFKDSTIAVIPDHSFHRFGDNLQVLEFSNCRIQRIESQAFSGLLNLQELVLRGNSISDVQSSWFESMNNLKRLSLPQNSIKTIQSAVFQYLQNLEELDISGNQLNCISLNTLSFMGRLHTMHAGNNPWSCLCQIKITDWMDSHRVRYDRNFFGSASIGDCEKEISVSTTTRRPHGHCTITRNINNYKHCQCVGGDLLVLDEIPSAVESIEIINATITQLPARTFRRFINLKKLLFYNSKIRDIDPLAFDGLYKLESLKFSDNNIPIIKSAWFNQMSTLIKLQLAGNSITKIEDGVFQNLPNLKVLSLADNMIRYVNISSMHSLNKLEEARIENNPWDWRSFKELVKFFDRRNISYPRFDTYQGNPLLCGDKKFSGEGSVEDCNVGVSVTGPTKLLPHAQGNCTFSGNTDNYGNCTCVGGDILVLDKIPDTIERIEIFNSTIPQLPADIFTRFKHLKKLLFSNCSIQNIDPLAFTGLNKLESLIFLNNNIPVIKSAWFEELITLTELRLEKNSITYIEADLFKHLPNLKILSLQDNSIECIYTNSINSLKKLEKASFENNPWKWRCQRELTQFLEVRNISYTNFESHQRKCTPCNMLQSNPATLDGRNSSGTTNTSISTVNVICISIAMLIFTKI